jgi:GGDEF domain-containing protein
MISTAKAGQSDMALCLMLVDDLLNLSIVHGLSGADAVEKALGDMLRVHFKAESLRARWGEGGFALAVPGESRATITEAMQMMVEEFSSIVFTNEQQVEFRTTFSAWLSGVPGDELTIENLMNMANIRMSRGRQLKAGSIVSVGN